jgi:hypothetical protein
LLPVDAAEPLEEPQAARESTSANVSRIANIFLFFFIFPLE